MQRNAFSENKRDENLERERERVKEREMEKVRGKYSE
jgi:hypothetical protein